MVLLILMLKPMTKRLVNIASIVDVMSCRKKKQNDVEKKVESQAIFLPYLARVAITQTLRLYYFEPGRPIRIKTDVLGYTIDMVLSKQIPNQQFLNAQELEFSQSDSD